MKFGIIIAVLFVVWQVISMIVQTSAKRQEAQRMRDATERRRQASAGQSRATGQRPDAPPTTRSTAGGAGQTSPGFARTQQQARMKSDLAARRQAQLEELRRRRQMQQGVQVKSGSARPTAGRAGTPPVASQRRSTTASTLQAGPDQWRAEQEREHRRRVERERQRDEQAERERLGRERREREEAERERQIADTPTGLGPAIGESAAVRRSGRGSVFDAVRMRQSLRQAIVLKELLDPPVALRAPQ